MIKKLRLKFILIVMLIVTLILSAIFVTMLLTIQNNNERMSVVMLHQALKTRAFSDGADRGPSSSQGEKRPPLEGPSPNMRMPVLIVEVTGEGGVSIPVNQLHFIAEEEVVPIVDLALSKAASMDVLSDYALRYLRQETEQGIRIAFADISIEQEILKAQVLDALLIGGLAMLAFLALSLLLSRWAVRPVEIAWEQQKQFVANASHELKTPLTVILSNTDMLRAEKDLGDDKNGRRMEHVHAEALRMKQLVEDMLTLAQSDSTEKTAIDDVADFSYMVKSVVLMYEPLIYDEGKKLSYDIEENLFIRGDLSQLQQAIHILLDNAQKYSSANGSIGVTLRKSDHKHLLLKVSNTGIPIAKDELERIFLRFYRRDEARSEHGSFGLGLSIAQGIVTMHRGKIWAESDEKGENRFCISLPLSPYKGGGTTKEPHI